MDILEELDITTNICQTIMVVEDYMQWFIDQGYVDSTYDNLGYVMHFSKRWNHTGTYQKQKDEVYREHDNIIAYKAGKLIYMADFKHPSFPCRRIRQDDILFTFTFQLDSYETSTHFYSYNTGFIVLKCADLRSPDKNMIFNKIYKIFIDNDQIAAYGDFIINGVKRSCLYNYKYRYMDGIIWRSNLLKLDNVEVEKPITVDNIYKLPKMNIKKRMDIPLFSLYDMIYTDFDIKSYNVDFDILEDNFISYL